MDKSQKEQIIKVKEAQIDAIEKTLDGVKISIEALSDGIDYEKQIKQKLSKYITSVDLINKEFKFQDSLDRKGAREAYIEFMTDISGDALENGIYIVCFVAIKNGVICATAGVFTKDITQNQRKKIMTIIYEAIDEIYSDGIIDFLKKPFQVIIEAINRAIYQWQRSLISNMIGTNNATINNAIFLADSGQIKTDAFINYDKSQSQNPHPTTNHTFPFKLIIKDYDLLTPLKNKEIQITNIDSKQCYESKITTTNGEVVFEIPQNERGDFFSVELINDDDYEINPYYLAKESNNVYIQPPHLQESNQDFNQESNNVDSSNFNNSNRPNYSNNSNNPSNLNNSNSFSNSNNQIHSNNPHSAHLAHTTNTKSIYQSKNTTNKILTPNNYQKYPATLYFKAKIYLYFNGFTLSVIQGNKEIASYEARSGTPLREATQPSKKQIAISYINISHSNKDNHNSQTNHSSQTNNDSQIAYFYYDKEHCDKEHGAIKEGTYFINIYNIIKNISPIESKESNYPFSIGRRWGNYNMAIYTDEQCNSQGTKPYFLYQVYNGEFGSAGSIGVIDKEIFERLLFLKECENGIIMLKVAYLNVIKGSIRFIQET